MDIEHLLNYSSENLVVMKSPTDEDIIREIMNTPANDDNDPYDSCILPNGSL